MRFDDLKAGLALSPVPVWLLDIDRLRICWANEAALELWQAPSAEALYARDIITGAPEKILTRLRHTIAAIRDGQSLREEWAFYPQGKPTIVLLHLCRVLLADGQVAMLNQALPVTSEAPPSLLRGITALRHTSLIIAYVNAQGVLLMQNPAAMATFPESGSWQDWLADPAQAGRLLERALAGERVQLETQVRTGAGLRWHAIDAQLLRDPVSGEQGALIQHVDVTARIEAEGTAAERLRVMHAQHEEILSLSAPILDLGRHTIAVPIIGALDASRHHALAERLLQAIVQRRSQRVLLDLTGVSGAASADLSRLRTLLAAVRLLGATPVLTGISAELARGMVAEGIELSQAAVYRTLADALFGVRGPS